MIGLLVGAYLWSRVMTDTITISLSLSAHYLITLFEALVDVHALIDGREIDLGTIERIDGGRGGDACGWRRRAVVTEAAPMIGMESDGGMESKE